MPEKRKNRKSTCKKIKIQLGFCLSCYMKVKSMWIKDLSETLLFMEACGHLRVESGL